MDIGTSASAAIWLMIAALPVGLFVAWSDMKVMKIPNVAVYALVVGFAVLGLIALPFPDYLWRWSHLVVVLLTGMVMNALRLIGAGDAKYAAAAAPYVALSDWKLIMVIFAGCLIAAWVTHRVARATPIRNLAPDWQSWTTGKRFPMGLALGPTLVVYLGLAIAFG